MGNSAAFGTDPVPPYPAGPQLAQAAGPVIGKVIEGVGSVFVVRADGSRSEISIGEPLYAGDLVETGPGGAAKLLFIDETTFSLASDAQLALDELVFNPATQSGTSSFSMLRGVFVFVSGQIAQTDSTKMTVTTPVATIGIRGTEVLCEVRAEGSETLFTVIRGAIEITTGAGSVLMEDRFDTTSVTSFEAPPTAPYQRTEEDVKALIQDSGLGNVTKVSGIVSPGEDLSPAGENGPPQDGETAGGETVVTTLRTDGPLPSPATTSLGGLVDPLLETPELILDAGVIEQLTATPPPPDNDDDENLVPPDEGGSEGGQSGGAPTGNADAFVAISFAGNIFAVDLNGNATLIGASGFAGLNAMARRNDGTLFAHGGGGQLISIDPDTGVGTLVSTTGVDIRGLAFDSANTLFGIQEGGDNLVTIDTGTGAVTQIGSLGSTGVQAFAISGSNTLFAYDIFNGLRTVDPNTGASVDVDGGTTSSSIQGLTFTSDGVLIGTGQDNGLFHIDTQTGTETFLGGSGFSDFRGIEAQDNSGGIVVLNNLNIGNSPGRLNIDGNLILTRDRDTLFELGGTEPGTGYDQLVVGETVILRGRAEIVEYDGFEASAGDRFDIVEANRISGGFDHVSGLDAGHGVVFDLEQSTDRISLVARAVTHQGTAGDDGLVGTVADDVMVGGAGRDSIVSGGGRDLMHGGDGDDVFVAPDFGFGRLDGGAGNDLFILNADGGRFDLTTLRRDQINGLETLDITGTGDNVLRIDTASLFGIAGFERADYAVDSSAGELVIEGDQGDVIELVGAWDNAESVVLDGKGYSVFFDSQTDTQIVIDDAVAISLAA